MKIKTLGKLGVWRSVASVSSMILILSIGGTLVTNEWSGYINKMLNINNTKIVTDEMPMKIQFILNQVLHLIKM